MSSLNHHYKVTDRTWLSFTGEPIGVGDLVVHVKGCGLAGVWQVIGQYLGYEDYIWLHTVGEVPRVGTTAGWNSGKNLVKVLPEWTDQDIKFHLAIIGATEE